jgi:molybdate transport system regulatory protein
VVFKNATSEILLFVWNHDMVKFKLKSSQWIVDENDNIIIGEGRMKILEHVENTGSINQAAKMMKMSYKAVWSKIKYTEKHLNAKIIQSDKKTGSRLTGEGKNLLKKYRLLKKKCMSADDKIFKNIFK